VNNYVLGVITLTLTFDLYCLKSAPSLSIIDAVHLPSSFGFLEPAIPELVSAGDRQTADVIRHAASYRERVYDNYNLLCITSEQ